jgi:hypothetical protein
VKALATIFKEAQTTRFDARRHSLIVDQCAEELKQVSVPAYKVHDLPPPPENGRYVLLGIAFYSRYDLEMLDAIAAVLSEGNSGEDHLVVFDILSCRNRADLETCIPGIGNAVQTPVAGVWENAMLVKKASGHAAVKMLRDYYRLALPNTDASSQLFWPYGSLKVLL